MTTEEVAKRLIELVEQGKNTQAQEELYHDEVVNYEQDGSVLRGKEAVMNKTKGIGDYFGEMYGTKVVPAYIGGDNFLMQFEMDFKPKGGSRTQMQDWGFYKLKDGKVIEEYFFAEPLRTA